MTSIAAGAGLRSAATPPAGTPTPLRRSGPPVRPAVRAVGDHLQTMGNKGLAPVMLPLTAAADATAVRRPLVLPKSAARLPDHVSIPHVPLRNQLSESANNNACGTNSLWMAMAFHLGADHVAFADLDRACRSTGFDLGSSPDFLAAYARKQGLAASVHHDSTTDDLRRMVAAGLPPIILTDWHADTTPGKSLHYLVVTGYSSLDDSKTLWTVNNPWGGKTETVDTATLMRRWSHLYLKPVHTPFNHLMLTVAPPAKQGLLPRSNPSLAQAACLGAVDALTVGAHVVEGVGRTLKRVGRMMPPIGVVPMLAPTVF